LHLRRLEEAGQEAANQVLATTASLRQHRVACGTPKNLAEVPKGFPGQGTGGVHSRCCDLLRSIQRRRHTSDFGVGLIKVQQTLAAQNAFHRYPAKDRKSVV